MNELKNALNGVQTVVFDLDGTLYDKSGLAARMVRRLWWCLPVLAAERLARRNMHYFQFASAEEFYTAFFANMARGHWWTAAMAGRWYEHVYMPAMVRLIARYHRPRPETMALLAEAKARRLKIAIYSDYGWVLEKLEALGIDPQQFDLMVDAPTLGALKPSLPCARRVLEMLQANPATTLFVGDRDEKDGASARSVGAKFLLIR
ncbi:MAG: HAD family hydrolase [Paludibacteraceae bacterium]|nr:HAD family hydrolase [Paludibacteraceae bacterium]